MAVIEHELPGLKLSEDFEQESSFRVGCLENVDDLNDAVETIKRGGIVVAQMRNVFGIWAKADDPLAVTKVMEVKGEVGYGPLSSMMFSHDILKYVDLKDIASPLRELIEDPSEIQDRIGSLCHIRLPLKSDLVEGGEIPHSIVSHSEGKYYIHNLDPYGHWPMTSFIKKANESGVKHIAVTSLNRHKEEKEIDNLERALDLCRRSGEVSVLLIDTTRTRGDIRGSFSIVDLDGLVAVREGIVPISLIERFLQVSFDKNGLVRSNYGHPWHVERDFEEILKIDTTPQALRAITIVYLNGDLKFD